MSPSVVPDIRFARPAALQGLEVRYSRYSQDAFHRHTHEAYAIGVITQGATNFTLYSAAGEERIAAGAGDVVLINPNQAHACNPLPDSGFTYYMYYLDEEFVQRLWRSDTDTPFMPPVFNVPVLHDRWLYIELLTQARLLLQPGRPAQTAPLDSLLSNLFFLYADAEQSAGRSESGVEDARLEACRSYLLAHLSEEIPLQTLADRCSLSPYYFVRAFHRRYGLPPHTYLLQQRIDLAKIRLREGKTVAEVAAEAGFADQSHFTRKFKALVGTTPGHYRLEMLKSAG